MSPLQPPSSMADGSLQAPSFSRGRAWEHKHSQCQSMGHLPTTHYHNAQGKLPIHKDMSLTTSRPALHKPTHKTFSTMELDEPHESCPLHECFSNSKKALNEIEGQLFPEFHGTEHPCTICILREEWAEGNSRPSSSE